MDFDILILNQMDVSNMEGLKTDKQKRIVASAIQLFSENGYSNTSTAQIAKHAHVSEGLIFKHYKTKENLLFFIIKSFSHRFVHRMIDDMQLSKSKRNKQSAASFFKEVITDRAIFIQNNLEIFKIIVKELFYKDELKIQIVPEFSKILIDYLKPVLTEYKEKKELNDLELDNMVQLVASAIASFFITNFVLLDKKTITEDEIDNLILFLMSGIGAKNK